MKKALLVCLWVLLVAAFQELVLRFAFPLPEVRYFNRAGYGMSSGTVERPIRSIVRVNTSSPDNAEFAITLNYYGFRGDNWRLDPPRSATRIMFVGDSFVEGIMALDGDAIPAQFERLADRRRQRVQAMNFGIAGADLQEDVQVVADAVPWFKPDWVILVFFANDFENGPVQLAAKHFEKWGEGLPRLLELARMVRGNELLPLRWPYRKVRVSAVVPDPANPFSDPAYEEEARRFVQPRWIDAMKRGDFNPFKAGCTQRMEPMLREPVDVRGELAYIRGVLSANGGRLLVAYLPERRQISNYYRRFEAEFSPDDFDMTQPEYQGHQRQLAEQCREQGIPFVDLSAAVAAEEGRGNHLYWQYDDHLNAAGNGVVAGALLAAWDSLRQPSRP